MNLLPIDSGLRGGVFIVTGGARGQGASLVRGLLGVGATVHIVDPLGLDDACWQTLRDASPDSDHLHIWNDDVAQPDTWLRLGAALRAQDQPVQGLVNNAGITGPRDTVTRTDLAEWNRVMAVNLTAAMLAIREIAPLMQQGGSIVNIGSTVGMTGYYSAAYSCSKWALRGLTRSAALELRRGGSGSTVCAPASWTPR